MKTTLRFRKIMIAGWLICASTGDAAERYVNVNNPAPMAPYTNWPTAATVIQDAVDAAQPGDEVVVTNGIYEMGGRAVHPGMTNRVAVTKPLTLRSVNGPEVTVIRGYQVPGTTNGDGAVRCVYLTNRATLVGFTLTNGAAYQGGGVWCETTTATLSNCVFTGNYAQWGGGAFGGTLDGCRLSLNVATYGGGGAVHSTLNHCVLTSNSAYQGGAAFNATLSQSTIDHNSAVFGGGVCQSVLNRCSVSENAAMDRDGYVGIGGGAATSTLTNCLVFGNYADSGGGAANSLLWNCTIVRNTAGMAGGGVWSVEPGFVSGILPVHFDADGCFPFPECELFRNHEGKSLAVNCIIYDNIAPSGPNHVGFTGSAFAYDGTTFLRETLNRSCTTPLPTNGVGNLTNAPLFVDPNAQDFRLQHDSPCINAGWNDYTLSSFDLNGNPRVVGGSVDIGAYEFQSPQSALSYAWLQQYGLLTDGSSDLVDSDGDGLNNWQEWRAWTDPTNATSALRLLTPRVTTNGLLVRWQSVGGQIYLLERSAGLAPSLFIPIASNVVGQEGATAYSDTNGGTGPFFYRLGVQE
jgi:hypothetical protein